MFFKQIKWVAVIVSFILILGIFYGFQHYQDKQTADELLYQLLNEIEEIEDVEIKEKPESLHIVLELAYVNNLYNTENEISKEVVKYLGDREFKIIFEDKRDEDLDEIFYRVHYSLQEAAVKGNFMEMSVKVEDIMDEHAVDDFRIIVGEKNLYFQLLKDDNYLYEVVPRSPMDIEKLLRERDSFD